MILVVAEKPSVGRNIAAIVGANKTEVYYTGYDFGNASVDERRGSQ